MQGGRGRSNPFFGFGDPFAGFGDMPSLFGGRDPFDDPFFTRPFGGIFSSGPGSPFVEVNPFGSSLFGSSLFGPSTNPSIDAHAPRIHESRSSLPNNARGPIIEELDSDDERDQPDTGDGKKENHQKHGRSEIEPYVEHPDDEFEGREPRQTQYGNDFSIMNNSRLRPQAHSFSFQSSTVTYGGSNGAYRTSSTTRRTGSDGLRFEEHKEADSATGQAAHMVSRGIHDKGHTVSRNLKSDGNVDTMQVLHNINEDELAGFEQDWKGKARKHLPGWTGGTRNLEGSGEPSRGGWALPSTEPLDARSMRPELGNDASFPCTQVRGRRRPVAGEHAQTPSSKARRY